MIDHPDEPGSRTATVLRPLDDGGTQAAARVLALAPARLLQNWEEAYARARAYLKALGIPEDSRNRLATRAVERALGRPWGSGTHAVEETLRALRELLQESFPLGAAPPESVDDFAAWRLAMALAPPAGVRSAPDLAQPGGPRDGTLRETRKLRSMPNLTRGHMTGHRLERSGLRRRITARRRPADRAWAGDGATGAATLPGAHPPRRRRQPWAQAATRRRLLLAILVLIPSIIASGFMVDVLPQQGRTPLETAIVICFGALFGWISIGFWTAVAGFVTWLRRRDRFRITRTAGEEQWHEIPRDARTAIVMPICDEPVERVFAGMRATYRSVERAGALEHFDFFLLSDTGDPGTWVREEAAWFDWCRELGRFDKLFYRHRRARIERKSGNIADFCRRWGRQYRYMVVLDADSVMAGETLARLVRLMEANPDVGLIQTVPVAVNRRSLFARIQQFANRIYGPVFAAGMHFWQLGDGHYWGHNAIIRIAAFMEHCSLPRLPGTPPLGGEILSHDFVEAALLGRAGWGIWLAFDLPGSYEEIPSTLLEELKRDRRWCQGNLQHLRLVFTEEFYGAHRALFLNGVLSYVSALLWFSFLTLSTAEAVAEAFREPNYFPEGRSLFPEWPIWRPDWALWLLAVTAAILFLPKALSVLLVLTKLRGVRAFGGAAKLAASVVLEIVVSSLFAPIRMLFHAKFVVTNLLGRTVAWRSQERSDNETNWREALRQHGLSTLVASVWGASVYWLSPDYFWWLTPIVAALLLSVPLSAWASRVRLGDAARRRGLFLTPEETQPPPELLDLAADLAERSRAAACLPGPERDGFVRAVVDPTVNAVHCALLGPRRALRPRIHAARHALMARALAEGPDAVDARARRAMLVDPELMSRVHEEVWGLDSERARAWGRPGTPSLA
jgi:membrane glycosyltransferase